jgi:hypothetical protein
VARSRRRRLTHSVRSGIWASAWIRSLPLSPTPATPPSTVALVARDFPIRKIYYNITTTSLSIFVAFVIGSIELLNLLSDQIGLTGQPWELISSININLAGRVIAASSSSSGLARS